MRQITFTLLVLLFCTTALTAQAQDKKTPEQKPAAQETTTDTEKPPSSVDKLVATHRERGDKVVARCLDDCEESADKPAGAGVLSGKAISLPKPVYPPIARAAHAEGAVEVQVLIDYEGNVIAAASISGHPLLQGASVQAARNSRFEPLTLDGQPVMVTGILRYNFVLP
jgi:TonB family protein